MINQQSAAMRSTSSMKQHKHICQLRTNTRPLALEGQTTTATEPGTTATTKHAILLSTYHHLRVAQLKNRRDLCIILYNPRGPGEVGVALLLLCFFSGKRGMCVCCRLCFAGAFTLSKSGASPQYIMSKVSVP